MTAARWKVLTQLRKGFKDNELCLAA
jgi:hypothetical protein